MDTFENDFINVYPKKNKNKKLKKKVSLLVKNRFIKKKKKTVLYI